MKFLVIWRMEISRLSGEMLKSVLRMRDYAQPLEEQGKVIGRYHIVGSHGGAWIYEVASNDELVRLTDSPVARLNRAVAVGEADGPRAGLAALAGLDPALPRHAAVAAYLHERDGDPVTGARLYAQAARSASNLPERDHQARQAARLNQQLRSRR